MPVQIPAQTLTLRAPGEPSQALQSQLALWEKGHLTDVAVRARGVPGEVSSRATTQV